jgi:putative peptidoglycan lipid II flippase
MVAGTVVTLVSLPVYTVLFHVYGAMGLAAASDFGIALQTLAIAILLHHRRMVSLASLDYRELGRCLGAAIVSGGAVWVLLDWLGDRLLRAWLGSGATHRRLADAVVLLAGGALWLVATDWVLRKSGSALPRVTRRRLGIR